MVELTQGVIMKYANLTTQELDALQELNRLIAAGVEYPDAQFRVSQQYGVDYETLQELYDSFTLGS